jgi:photosystem II cytochrome c550
MLPYQPDWIKIFIRNLLKCNKCDRYSFLELPFGGFREYKKPYILGIVLTTLFFANNINGVNALELDDDTRTVTLDANGNNVIITSEQVKRGKRLFNNACGTCHVGGLTKTNPNVGLDTESLSLATPPRDSITSLVSYLKEPMTYDGLDSISELHPSIKSADIFPKMRSLTDEDLFAIAGHILLQPKVVNEKWGGGKIYY